MPPTFNAVGTRGGTSGNGNASIPLPAGVLVDDQTWMWAWTDAGTLAITTNGAGATWAALAGSPWAGPGTEKLYVWQRVAAGGDGAPTLTASGNTATGSFIGAIIAYTDVDPATPVEVIGTAGTGTGTAITIPAVTTLSANAVALALLGHGDNGSYSGQQFGGSGTGVTERTDQSSTAGDDAAIYAADKTIVSAGTTGAFTVTQSLTGPWIGIVLSLTPFAVALEVGGSAPESASGGVAPTNVAAATVDVGGTAPESASGGVDVADIPTIDVGGTAPESASGGVAPTNVAATALSVGGSAPESESGGVTIPRWETDALNLPITFGPATDPGGGTVPVTQTITFATPPDFADTLESVVLSLYVTADHVDAASDLSKGVNKLEIQIESPQGDEEFVTLIPFIGSAPFSIYGDSFGESAASRLVFTDGAPGMVGDQEDPPYVGDYLPEVYEHDWLIVPKDNTFTDIFRGVNAVGTWTLTFTTWAVGVGATMTIHEATLTLLGVESDLPPSVPLSAGGTAPESAAGGVTPVGFPPEPAPAGDSDPTIYAPAVSHPDLHSRWAAGQHIGAYAPRMVVEVRRGRWDRGFRTIVEADAIDAVIPGEERLAPWMTFWTPSEPWQELPGVLAYREQQDFEQNGAHVVTLEVDNVRFSEIAGTGGTYHELQRGFLSPARSYDPPGRPEDTRPPNEWFDRLARMAQVRVWHGYGEPTRVDDEIPADGGPNGMWVFAGQIDDVDLDAAPDHITVTCRDGQPLTDERLFGWNKSKQLRDPITFADAAEADDITLVASGEDASSSDPGYPADGVIDKRPGTMWISTEHSTPDNTEWVEIRVPPGRYTDFILHPAFAGMEVYIGFFAHGTVEIDGDPGSEGWQTTDEGGTVPGVNGGWEYLRMIPVASGRQMRRKLGATITVSEESVLRIGFRNLAEIYSQLGGGGGGETIYQAGVVRLQARKRVANPIALEQRWIFVEDVSDIVRVVLRWAGYQDTAIETTGVRLKGSHTFNRQTFLIDVINKAVEQTGYSFFFQKPLDGDRLALPTFRMNGGRWRPPNDELVEVTDNDLITAVSYKNTMEPLAYIIRVRGKERNADSGGVTLGGDSVSRIMAVYRPPWGFIPGDGGPDRLAGLIKHVVYTRPELRTLAECDVACKLIAFEEALYALQAVVEIPGHPGLQLDDQVGVTDATTAINSRLWIAQRSVDFHTGVSTSWRETLTGALLDSPDVAAMLVELEEVNE